MRRTLHLLVGLVLAWTSAALGLDRYGLPEATEGRWDLIIVAGCRVMPDGSPSPALARRTAAAVDMWRAGLAPAVVFTGGVGDHGPSEASVAARHALDLGLPEEAIRIEDRSTSTEENAQLAAIRHPAARVLVVSDTYHIFRVERVFRRYYPEVRGVGSTPLAPWRVRGALREVAAVAWYGWTGRL